MDMLIFTPITSIGAMLGIVGLIYVKLELMPIP